MPVLVDEQGVGAARGNLIIRRLTAGGSSQERNPSLNGANSLLAGKIQGIHPILALMMPIGWQKGTKGHSLTSKIPYATEQGINSTVSGI
jgi:hypothetical protein